METIDLTEAIFETTTIIMSNSEFRNSITSISHEKTLIGDKNEEANDDFRPRSISNMEEFLLTGESTERNEKIDPDCLFSDESEASTGSIVFELSLILAF